MFLFHPSLRSINPFVEKNISSLFFKSFSPELRSVHSREEGESGIMEGKQYDVKHAGILKSLLIFNNSHQCLDM